MPLNPLSQRLQAVDSLTIDVITDDVSDAYVTKTLFAVSEFANIVKGGAKEISGETLLLANLGLLFTCKDVPAVAASESKLEQALKNYRKAEQLNNKP